MKPDYNYIFHYSHWRKNWAYIHREELENYWEDRITLESRITFGQSPSECVEKAIERGLHE